jgi:Spy/CpxP family protein refolding chaperone
MKRTLWITLTIAGALLLMGASLLAQAASQRSAADQEIKLLREDVQSQRKQIVAANLTLTDDEAIKFWPVFDQYTAELAKTNDSRLAVVKEYAANYDTLTDEQAASLLKKSIEMDQALLQLRLKYVPLFQKVLPGKKTATFFQIDRRISMLIELQLAASIPLVNP